MDPDVLCALSDSEAAVCVCVSVLAPMKVWVCKVLANMMCIAAVCVCACVCVLTAVLLSALVECVHVCRNKNGVVCMAVTIACPIVPYSHLTHTHTHKTHTKHTNTRTCTQAKAHGSIVVELEVLRARCKKLEADNHALQVCAQCARV